MSLVESLRRLEGRAEGRFALVVSGASGGRLAQVMARALACHPEVAGLHLVLTAPATKVLGHELGIAAASVGGFVDALELAASERAKITGYRDSQLEADIASGSYRLDGTVVVPCSSGMASSIAQGISRGLGQRVADVALKQRWPLVLGIRESPLSAVLLDNLARLAALGVHIAPPIPAFYLGPDDESAMATFLDHYALRVLDLLGLAVEAEALRWR